MKHSAKINSAAVSEVEAANRLQRGATKRRKDQNEISIRAARSIAGPCEALPQHLLTSANGAKEPAPTAGADSAIEQAEASSVVRDASSRSPEQFALELENARRIGPAELTNELLLDLCKGAFGHFKRVYWIKARPLFSELWRRLEQGLVPGIRTKAEACERIGCSIRWAQMIVSGFAEQRNQKKLENRSGCAGSSLPQPPSANEPRVKYAGSSRVDRILTVEEYVIDIQRFAYRKLRKVREQRWDRYRNVCKIVAEDFRHACEIEGASEVKAA